MPIGPKRMPFCDHLEELRRRLIIIVGLSSWPRSSSTSGSWDIFEFLMAPSSPSLDGQQLTSMGPFELFTLRFKVALFGRSWSCSPIMIYQVMAFFCRRSSPRSSGTSCPRSSWRVVLFFAGQRVLLLRRAGPGVRVDAGSGDSDTVRCCPRPRGIFTGVTLFLLGFGLGFEMPVVVFDLIVFDIVPYEKMRETGVSRTSSSWSSPPSLRRTGRR